MEGTVETGNEHICQGLARVDPGTPGRGLVSKSQAEFLEKLLKLPIFDVSFWDFLNSIP